MWFQIRISKLLTQRTILDNHGSGIYTNFGSINNPYLKMYSQPFDWGSSGFEPAHL
jgi:hypothetical protein